MATATTTPAKLKLNRRGNSDYGRTVRLSNGTEVVLRVFGTYVSGSDPTSTVHNAWVWTAQINGKTVDAPETLRRRRDAVELLESELAKMEAQVVEPATTANGKSSTTAAADRLKEQADTTHPMFRAKPGASEGIITDPLMRTTVRIKGTTIVGVVIAKTIGEQERLRLELPDGSKAWASPEVVEAVSL